MKIYNEVKEYLSNKKNLEELFILEKKRRKTDKNELCFLGTANIASYWYCAMKSYYKSINGELDFFSAYFIDRINYSKNLGLIKKLPEEKEKWLCIGEEITLEDINRLLEDRKKYIIECIDERDAGKEKDKFIRGEILEHQLAEKYPRIRWNFKWNNYVIVGAPDGITDDFVYEFKTTTTSFMLHYIRPVAKTQADLYGYFFNRKNKRIQIHILEENKIETIYEEVDIERAIKTLKFFKKTEENKRAVKPIKWKCNKCEFLSICASKN